LGDRLTEKFSVWVVGAGYVGLVTGACLAHVGHRVTLVDTNAGRVAELKAGRVHIYEPGLGKLLAGCAERLRFSTDLAPAAREADVVFIAVGTPQGEGGSADLSNVGAVARTIGRTLAGEPGAPLVVVNKSTVPVRGGDYVSMLVHEGAEEAGGGEADYLVFSNPEFLREGSAVYDSLFPDRIVVGGSRAQRSTRCGRSTGPSSGRAFRPNWNPGKKRRCRS